MTRLGWPRIAAAVIGFALALAPVGFKMFDRALMGGHMIDGFRPYMNESKIDSFRAELQTIGAARADAASLPSIHAGSTSTSAFVQGWPAIDHDMTSMLDTMQHNIGHYRGVAALPPFPLFPWFFVIPGLLAAILALVVRRPARWFAALGVGLVLAPAVFQMFTRAPGGPSMIDDFRPFMTPAKVEKIQGYFLTIGTAEAELRHDVIPNLPPRQAPHVAAFSQQWPHISADMAPMIGAMSDNVGNFAAVDALPPFGLFPWFFVAPGVLLVGLAFASRTRARTKPSKVVLESAVG